MTGLAALHVPAAARGALGAGDPSIAHTSPLAAAARGPGAAAGATPFRVDGPLVIPAAVGSGLLIGMALGLLLGITAQRHRARAGLRRRFHRARVAESDAVALLRSMGFEVLDAQVQSIAHLMLDGERVECTVRADFLVRRDRELALVEVKSGAAPRLPGENETRRQLLEYWFAFGGVPILHLDATTGTLTRVGFEYGDATGAHPLAWTLVGLAALVATAFFGMLALELGLFR